MMLRQALGTMAVQDLRSMARLNHLQLPTNAWKDLIIDVLVEHLTSRTGIDAILQGLSSNERAALDDLIAAGGLTMARPFVRDHGAIRYQTPSGYGATQVVEEPLSAADGLAMRGLVFRAIGAVERWTGEVVAIADDVLPLLPRVARRSFAEILTTAEAPAVVLAAPDLIRDIGAFLCYLQRETVRPVHGDHLAKRDLLKLAGEFTITYPHPADARNESDLPYFSFVRHVSRLLGLVTVQGTVMTPTALAEEWLGRPLDHQVSDAWRRFLKDGSWDDVKQSVERQFVNTYPGLQHIIVSRNRLTDALKTCPAGAWLSLSSFSEGLCVHAPSFMRTTEQTSTWASWSISEFYGSWQDVEAAYIAHAMATWLSWFGIVLSGSNEKSTKPTVFHITQRGAVLLGIAKGPIAGPEPQPIIVQANFEIVVPFETPANVVFRLQQFASMTKRDRASLYLLSPAAVWKSLQAGRDIEDIIRFLEKASQRPLAQNVAYSLREWATKHGEITIEPAILLTTSSDSLMAQVRSSKRLPAHIKEIISPRAVTIEGDIPGLIEQLKKAGFWPKAAEGLTGAGRTGQDGRGSVMIRPGNLVQLLVGVILLAHIAEREGWESPVDSATISSLSWNLAPALVKQVDRMASEAIARYAARVASQEGEST
jgi:hypothetical protein